MLAGGGVDMTFDELKQKGFYKVPFKYRKYENGGFKTPTGKIELYSTRFEQMGYAPLPSYEEPPESPISTPEIAAHYPLVLTTGGRISFFFNSEHRQIDRLRKAHRDPMAEIHPDTAARFGIVNGAWMWIETKRGRMRQKAKLTDGHRPAGHPRRARLVVSRAARPGIRRVYIECQPLDRQQAALRSRRWGLINCARLLCRVAPADVPTVDSKKVGV